MSTGMAAGDKASMKDWNSTDVVAGCRLFCAGEPGLAPGVALPPGQYGRRLLQRPILTIQEASGKALAEAFDLGPRADDLFDPSRPRQLTGVHPWRTIGVLGELVWEVVRGREYPDRPSRLEGAFFWADLSAARDWQSRRTWPACLYEAEVLECRRAFLADLSKVQFHAGDGTVAALMDQAHRYWSEPAADLADAEVLLEGVVHVIRPIT